MDHSAEKHVYVGSRCEIAGQEYVLGSEISLTPAQLQDLDKARTHFITKAEFDSIFGPEDAAYLSPQFLGEWSPAFNEKVQMARDIVHVRRGA